MNDLRCTFEEDSEARGHAYQITGATLMLGSAILNRHCTAENLPVICGDLLDFRPTYATDYSSENRARALERLLGIQEVRDRPYGQVLDLMTATKTSLLLPYIMGQHYLVFELILRSDRGRMIKVWDGGNVWGKGNPRRREEVMTLLDVFFGGDTSVPVYVWEKGDPAYAQCHGAGAFMFMIMCYRVYKLRPQDWGTQDEAVARNFLWTCIVNGAISKVPRLKL